MIDELSLGLGWGPKHKGPKLVRGWQVSRSIYEGSALLSGSSGGPLPWGAVVAAGEVVTIQKQPYLPNVRDVGYGTSWSRWKANEEGYLLMVLAWSWGDLGARGEFWGSKPACRSCRNSSLTTSVSHGSWRRSGLAK